MKVGDLVKHCRSDHNEIMKQFGMEGNPCLKYSGVILSLLEEWEEGELFGCGTTTWCTKRSFKVLWSYGDTTEERCDNLEVLDG